MKSMIWTNQDPFKKNKREALIKKMVLKPLGDEIWHVSCRFYGTESPPNCLPFLVFLGVVFRLKVVGPEIIMFLTVPVILFF